MSHPDDGIMESLLDGELDAEERLRVELHVSGCASCAARLAEARELRKEADRLVEVLAVPSSPVPARQVSPRRRTVIRTLAWAASIVVAVALGYWGRGPGPGQPIVLQEGDRQAGGRAEAPVPSNPTAKPLVASPPATSATGQAPVESARPAATPSPESRSADTPAAKTPPPTPPSAERELEDARANEVAAKAAMRVDEPTAAWRVISMEEGVRLLGGQIRLIDGLAPDRVETGPGTAVPGAEPSLPLVRVIYASGSVILDQQRPATEVAARREADAYASGAAAQRSLTAWQERGGIRFVVTGSVSADSLRALGTRVR